MIIRIWSIKMKLLLLFISAVLCSEIEEPFCSVETDEGGHRTICEPSYCHQIYIEPLDNIICENMNQMLETPNMCENRKCIITLSNNDVNVLRTNSFVKFPYLENIFLSNSKFESIQSNAFSGSSQLISINLDNNNITHLIEGSFSSLPKLEFLNLSSNSIEQIDINSFKDLSSVTNLDLSYNDIKKLNSEILQPLYQLKVLNISNNMLTEIDEDVCYHLNFLEYFILDNNRIELLPNCSANSKIEVFSLSGNFLTFLNESLLPKNLKTLYLSNNKLTTLNSTAFVNLKKLQSLDISRNGLTEIPSELFKNMENLLILDISQNEIENLDYGIFYGLSNLQLLNLSYNNLEKMETHIFLPLINLINIDVSHNKIERFDIEFLLNYSHNLTMLNIGANNFSCPDLANMILYAKTKEISMPHSITLSGQCTDKSKENTFVTVTNDSKNFFSTYFEEDFKKSAFYKFFQNFNSSVQDNGFKSYSKETIKIQKDLAQNLVRTEAQFFQKFLDQFSRLSTQIKDDKQIKPIIMGSTLSKQNLDHTEIEDKTENFQKFFEEFETSINEKMSNFEHNNLIQTSSALKNEDDRIENIMSAITQMKLFFILCTLILLAFFVIKLTRHFKPTFNLNPRNRQESRELPFVDEYNT